MNTTSRSLDRGTGFGLVISSMIGSGVFLSTGFMMQNQSPELIIMSWIFGAIIALSGALAYAEIASINGCSGGEYRYLYDYLHPFIGYLAGWASLLIGFSAPIAIDAYAAAAFLNKAGFDFPYKTTGILIITGLSLVHGLHLYCSRFIQNLFSSSKFIFILIFIAIGILGGQNSWPDWHPPSAHSGFSLHDFFENQYWIAFAFSGWNAAIYIAGEYKSIGRDVYFSLIAGCLVVGGLYLAINWIFIANLSPLQSLAVVYYDKTQITLAHVIIEQIIGTKGAQAASMVACLVFLSAISSMTFVGPRIYAQMAVDGLLPKLFASQAGKPPLFSIILQSSISILLLYTQSIRDIILACSAILMLFSMLTALILLNIQRDKNLPDVPKYSIAAALFYVTSVIAILCTGEFWTKSSIWYVFGAILLAGSLGYWAANIKPGQKSL